MRFAIIFYSVIFLKSSILYWDSCVLQKANSGYCVLIQKMFIALYRFTNVMKINASFLSFIERKWAISCFINFFEWVSSVCLTFELIKHVGTPNLSTLWFFPIFIEVVAKVKPIQELEQVEKRLMHQAYQRGSAKSKRFLSQQMCKHPSLAWC